LARMSIDLIKTFTYLAVHLTVAFAMANATPA
jgi:uncharacterized membrane protein